MATMKKLPARSALALLTTVLLAACSLTIGCVMEPYPPPPPQPVVATPVPYGCCYSYYQYPPYYGYYYGGPDVGFVYSDGRWDGQRWGRRR